MKFNFRIHELEVRTFSRKDNISAKIVKWNDGDKTCYTLALWEKGREGYELRFVADRPFFVNSDNFMFLAEMGQGMLDKHFEKEGA